MAFPGWQDEGPIFQEVCRTVSRDQAYRAKEALAGLTQAWGHARFHQESIEARVREITELAGHRGVELILFGGRLASPHGPRFQELWGEGGAHLLAAVRTVHTTSDLAGMVVYHALSLASPTLKENQVKLDRLERALAKAGADLGLLDAVRKLSKIPELRYIAEVTNRSKHRAVIEIGYMFRPERTGRPETHCPELSAFDNYPGVASDEFFRRYVPAQQQAVNDVLGHLLHALNQLPPAP